MQVNKDDAQLLVTPAKTPYHDPRRVIVFIRLDVWYEMLHMSEGLTTLQDEEQQSNPLGLSFMYIYPSLSFQLESFNK